LASEWGPTRALLPFARTGPRTTALAVKFNRTGTATYGSDYP